MPENAAHSAPVRELTPAERLFVAQAVAYIEKPSYLMRLANLAGKPIEAAIGVLPAKAYDIVNHATTATLDTALHWAIRTLPDRTPLLTNATDAVTDATAAVSLGGATDSANSLAPDSAAAKIIPAEATLPVAPGAGKPGKLARMSLSPRLHAMMAATTGAVGGMFGLAGLALEAPATTAVMLRSIAATAARQGADLDDPVTRLQCLSVLSLGAPAMHEMDSAYFTARFGMALAVRESAQFIAKHNATEVAAAVARGTAPSLVRLMSMIAARFQIVLTEKFAAQIVPIAGAVAGAAINAAFTDHFNAVANYHFGILRLERTCGAAVVHAAYEDACRQAIAGRAGRLSS